jgi:hypothetical protein
MQNLSKIDDKYSVENKENSVPAKQPRAILPINRSLQAMRKKVPINPNIESLLQSPITPKK